VVFFVVFARLTAVLRKTLHSIPRVLVYRFDMECGSTGTFFLQKLSKKNLNFVPVDRCDYMPTQLGVHSVNVFFAGNPIPNSPFGVKVSVICNCIQSSICGTCIARLKILQQFFPKLFWIILVYLPVGSLFRNLSVT
jgi:hypothetical protein